MKLQPPLEMYLCDHCCSLPPLISLILVEASFSQHIAINATLLMTYNFLRDGILRVVALELTLIEMKERNFRACRHSFRDLMGSLPKIEVNIWSDVACPWCWVGMQR